MSNFIPLIVIFIGIPLLGLGLFKAARWSRLKNEELKANHDDCQEKALQYMFQGKKGAITKFYTSSISKPEAMIGIILSIGVIIFFLLLALVVSYYVWNRI